MRALSLMRDPCLYLMGLGTVSILLRKPESGELLLHVGGGGAVGHSGAQSRVLTSPSAHQAPCPPTWGPEDRATSQLHCNRPRV